MFIGMLKMVYGLIDSLGGFLLNWYNLNCLFALVQSELQVTPHIILSTVNNSVRHNTEPLQMV